ncbi:GNAT family N-acetyltransferase [Faunimonas pinastri]|nr:GNAT family protein [Faunimonas pinastri]
MNANAQPAPSPQGDFPLRRASPADIPFIMATERGEGYERFVGRWEEARHRQAFADPSFAYFIGQKDGVPAGFVLVEFWGAANRKALVRRIAVRQPGQGHGRRMLAAVVSRIFDETDAHRVWLGLFPENLRARRTYQAVGFQAEGVERSSVYMNGEFRDQLIMAVLRPEWEAIRLAGASRLE